MKLSSRLLCSLLSLLLMSCAAGPGPVLTLPTPGDIHGIGGEKYKQELVKTLESADRIEVAEHSYLFDMPEVAHPGITIDELQRTVPRFDYAKVDLSASAKSALLKRVKAMSPTQPSSPSTCLFSPHHTIRFYKGSKLLSTMRVCFVCSQVEWWGTYDARPNELVGILAGVVKSCGFSTSTDESYWERRFAQKRASR